MNTITRKINKFNNSTAYRSKVEVNSMFLILLGLAVLTMWFN